MKAFLLLLFVAAMTVAAEPETADSNGKIERVLENGVIVYAYFGGKTPPPDFETERLVFLTGYPKQKTAAEGDAISVRALRIGNYKDGNQVIRAYKFSAGR